ncbi:MAG: SBBP repeat-containing protein [Deinococcales bacterium]
MLDADGDALTCTLDVEMDGVDDVSFGDCVSVTSHVHGYAVPGLYTVKLSVNDGHGHTVFETANVIANGTNSTVATWLRQFGSGGTDFGEGIAVAEGGHVVVAGYTSGSLGGYPNAGLNDVFVARFDAQGTALWVRQLGTSAQDDGYDVAVDSAGNAFVVGRTYGAMPGQASAGLSDAFVAKYDVQGTLLWVRQFGTSAADEGHGVAADGVGNVFVVGNTAGAFPGQLSAGLADVFVAKYSSQGTQLWARQFGSSNGDFGTDVAVDGDGNALLAGSTYDALPGQTSAGGADAFLAKMDGQGGVLWVRQFGTSAGDGVDGVALGADGSTVVVGSTSGTLPGQVGAGSVDVVVAAYDAQGSSQWTLQFGTAGADYGRDVAIDGMGNAVLIGETDGSLPGNVNLGLLDALVAKVDDEGTLVWTRQFGSSATEFGAGVAVNSVGEAIATGYTAGTLPGQTSLGAADALLVKYLP